MCLDPVSDLKRVVKNVTGSGRMENIHRRCQGSAWAVALVEGNEERVISFVKFSNTRWFQTTELTLQLSQFWTLSIGLSIWSISVGSN
jgi:hypothetical protein